MIQINFLEAPVQDVVDLMRQAFPGVPLSNIRGIVQQPSGSWTNIASGQQVPDENYFIEDALRRLRHERPCLLIVNRTRQVTFFSDLLNRIPSLAGAHQTAICHLLPEDNGDIAYLLSA